MEKPHIVEKSWKKDPFTLEGCFAFHFGDFGCV